MTGKKLTRQAQKATMNNQSLSGGGCYCPGQFHPKAD